MADYRLSRLALSDLKWIGQYTLENWGDLRADRYIEELRKILNLLAANPELGRACEEIRKGYRRLEHGRHIVFYRIRRSASAPHKQHVEIIRILHQRMLPQKYFPGE